MSSALIDVTDNIAYIINSIWLTLGMIVLTSFTIYHIITTRKYGSNAANEYPKSLLLSFLLIIFGFLVCSALFLELINPFSSVKYCWFIKYWSSFTYCSFKLILYSILVFRLYEAYNNSPIGYKHAALYCWQTTLTIWSVIGLLLLSFTGGVNFTPDASHKCTVIWFMPAVGFNVLLDMTAGVLNSYLFLKPLFKMNKFLRNTSDSKEHDSVLHKLAIKQSVLAVIAIFSSLMVLFGAIMINMEQVIISMDLILTIGCIILMYQWNDIVSDKIFICCYHKAGIEVNDNVKNMKDVIETATKNSENTLEVTENTENAPSSNVGTTTASTSIQMTIR